MQLGGTRELKQKILCDCSRLIIVPRLVGGRRVTSGFQKCPPGYRGTRHLPPTQGGGFTEEACTRAGPFLSAALTDHACNKLNANKTVSLNPGSTPETERNMLYLSGVLLYSVSLSVPCLSSCSLSDHLLYVLTAPSLLLPSFSLLPTFILLLHLPFLVLFPSSPLLL